MKHISSKILFKNLFNKSLNNHLSTIKDIEMKSNEIFQIAKLILKTIKKNNKLIFCGNGGSAADSQHIAAEFICKFKKNRRPLPAISLTVDTSVITSISNDFSFEYVFSRQIQALGKKSDCLIGISTSGNSKNIKNAFIEAKKKEIKCIALLGNKGGFLKKYADIPIIINSSNTARIQEAHIFLMHLLCEYVDLNY